MPITPAPDDVFTMAPPAAFEHERNLVLHAEENAVKIDVDDAIPLLFVVLGDGCGALWLDACIVKSEVEAAERVSGFVQCGFDLIALRHIATHRECATASLLDQPRGFLIRLLAKVRHGNARARACKRQRRRAPYAARRSGNERDPVCEVLITVCDHFSFSAELCHRLFMA
jgi:hypothetical protein